MPGIAPPLLNVVSKVPELVYRASAKFGLPLTIALPATTILPLESRATALIIAPVPNGENGVNTMPGIGPVLLNVVSNVPELV